MKSKLTKVVVDENRHSYIRRDQAQGLYGFFSRTVMPFDDERWCVEARDGARFVGRTLFDSVRDAVTHAKQGGVTDNTQRGRGWHTDMAKTLYHSSSGAVEALQAYIDRCCRRGLRVDLDRYINMAHGEDVMGVAQ